MLPNLTIEEVPTLQLMSLRLLTGYIRGWPITIETSQLNRLNGKERCVFVRPETVLPGDRMGGFSLYRKGVKGSTLMFAPFWHHRVMGNRTATMDVRHHLESGMLIPLPDSMDHLPTGTEVSDRFDARHFEDCPMLQRLFIGDNPKMESDVPVQSKSIPPLYDHHEVTLNHSDRHVKVMEYVPGMRVEMRTEGSIGSRIKVRLRNKHFDLTDNSCIRPAFKEYFPNFLRFHKLFDLTKFVFNFVVSYSKANHLVLVGHNQGEPYWETLTMLSQALDIPTHPVLYSNYEGRMEMPCDLHDLTEVSSSFIVRQRVQKAIVLFGGKDAYHILRPHVGIVSETSVKALKLSRFNSSEIPDIYLKHSILQKENHV